MPDATRAVARSRTHHGLRGRDGCVDAGIWADDSRAEIDEIGDRGDDRVMSVRFAAARQGSGVELGVTLGTSGFATARSRRIEQYGTKEEALEAAGLSE